MAKEKIAQKFEEMSLQGVSANAIHIIQRFKTERKKRFTWKRHISNIRSQ